MKVKSLIIILLVVSLSSFTSDHALKMSFSKLTISSGSYVELETRIFLDDLTEHIEKLYSLQQADFSSTTSNGTQALLQYLKDQFYFEQDGKKINLSIDDVSFSKNRIALVLNMGITKPLDISKEVFLINTLLCDASPMQTNDIKYNDKHYNLNISHPKIKIEIN